MDCVCVCSHACAHTSIFQSYFNISSIGLESERQRLASLKEAGTASNAPRPCFCRQVQVEFGTGRVLSAELARELVANACTNDGTLALSVPHNCICLPLLFLSIIGLNLKPLLDAGQWFPVL